MSHSVNIHFILLSFSPRISVCRPLNTDILDSLSSYIVTFLNITRTRRTLLTRDVARYFYRSEIFQP